MPLIKTRGAASSRGFGQFNRSAFCGGDGTVGIFALGSNPGGTALTTRNKYTYSSDTSTASGVGSASNASNLGNAAGNSTRGIFKLGNGSPASVLYTNNKYTYATCASTACGVATFTCSSFAGSAAGNSTRGIFTLGQNFSACAVSTSRTYKYTYATCTSTGPTTNLGGQCYYGGAAGNATRAIFNMGMKVFTCPCIGYVFQNQNIRRKYTYACDTTAAGASGTSNSVQGAAAGNSTRGIFALGTTNCCTNNKNTTRNKYTYACDTNTGSGVASASIASTKQSATGNSTRGIFALGNSTFGVGTNRDKYTYACDTNTGCVGAASVQSRCGSAASWVIGVNSAA